MGKQHEKSPSILRVIFMTESSSQCLDSGPGVERRGLCEFTWAQPLSWTWMETKSKAGAAEDSTVLCLLPNLMVERKCMPKK